MSSALACAAGLWALHAPAGAADETPKVRCKARLWRTPDDKEARYITVDVPVGKTVEAIDGDRDFRVVPAAVNGLKVVFKPKLDGDNVALHADAVYRTFVVDRVGGGQTWITASTTVDVSLPPSEQFDVAMDVNGTPYTLTLWAKRL